MNIYNFENLYYSVIDLSSPNENLERLFTCLIYNRFYVNKKIYG